MTEIIDIELVDDFVNKPIVKQHQNQSSKPKAKKRGQLTFDDFRNIKIVEKPVVLSHIGSIDESLDAATHTNKRENDEDVNDEALQTKRSKTNTMGKHSNIKTHPNDVTKTELINVNINNSNRPLYTLNWSPNIPLRFSDSRKFVAEGTVMKREWAPPLCVSLPYAGDIMKVLSFIVKFKSAFTEDLLNLSFQDVEIGLELAATEHSIEDIRLCQNKMNLLFCVLLRTLFNSDKGTENHSHKNFTLERFLSLKDPYAKLAGKLKIGVQEWGLPQEWRDSNDLLYILNIGKHGLLTMKPLDRIILLRSMIDWNCSYSSIFHSEIQRFTHLKGDTGYSHQTFHVARFTMCGAESALDCFEVLCSLMNQKLENRKKRKSQDESKLNEINEQIKYLKDVRKSLDERPITDKLQATIKVNEQWNKYFANELSHTPIDDPMADEIYRLRSSEFMIARIPKFGDFYLPPFRIRNNYDSVNITYNFNEMGTYVDYYMKLKKKNTMALNKPPARIARMENNCQIKLICNDTSACIRDLLSNDASLAKASRWFEVSGDLDSLTGFIQYLESISSLKENIVDDTKKGIDNLIEFLKIFSIFISETIQTITDANTESILRRHPRINSRQIRKNNYSADVDSDKEGEITNDSEVDDDYDSEYSTDEDRSKKENGSRATEYPEKIEIDSEANDQGVNYSDIEIFSEPVRDQHNDSREKRNLRRNARRNLPC
ncbi:hypothetical protein SKDZ_15G1370 [Saccharomyces kudriavzevii ZP591]|nr:hypothetical protein SKDZ_15G1370 [Saccharomyces kudriavzevii ZP591]